MSARIRQLQEHELTQNDPKGSIIFVAEIGTTQIGRIGLGTSNGLPYAFNLETLEGHPEIACRLIQRVRTEAKRQGHSRVLFTVEPNNPALMALIVTGRARVELVWASVEA